MAQIIPIKERDMAAVRRPERRLGAIGAGQCLGVELVEGPYPQHDLAFGILADECQLRAIWRDVHLRWHAGLSRDGEAHRALLGERLPEIKPRDGYGPEDAGPPHDPGH